MRINAQSIIEHGKPLEAMFVDHIHITRATPGDEGRSTNDIVGGISRNLKAMAMPDSLGVPIIAGAQLNRKVEARGDGRPTLADLRDSGSLEQDADNVVFTYPKLKYISLAEQKKAKAAMKPGYEPYELLVAKHRDGPEGVAYLAWKKETGDLLSLTNAPN
jgi:replicative DNA helicase